MKGEPPTGIIRTLPAIYADPASDACKGYRAAIAEMEHDDTAHWFLALAQHVYIVIGGKIDARFTFAGYREGGRDVRLWDGEIRAPKCWAILAGPASRPPQPVPMRGFQGFRYTPDLW